MVNLNEMFLNDWLIDVPEELQEHRGVLDAVEYIRVKGTDKNLADEYTKNDLQASFDDDNSFGYTRIMNPFRRGFIETYLEATGIYFGDVHDDA